MCEMPSTAFFVHLACTIGAHSYFCFVLTNWRIMGAGDKRMNAEIITSIILSTATLLGTILTVWSGSKLTAYRIEQLEKRVSEYNNTKLRMYEAEKKQEVDENRLKVCEHRLSDIEEALRSEK